MSSKLAQSVTSNQSPIPSNQATCKDCRFLQTVEGGPAPIFYCKHKVGFEKRSWNIEPGESCPNFDDHGHTPADIAAALTEGAKLIPLTQGKFAIVDAEDYDRFNKYKWHASKNHRIFYAKTQRPSRLLPMHRIILNAPPHLVVDHINHNGLDNRKANLRLCTRAQNNRNARPRIQRNKRSKYKGVSFDKNRNLFKALIQHNKKVHYLGSFKNETDTAKAYDKKAKELFGEFAYLNFP